MFSSVAERMAREDREWEAEKTRETGHVPNAPCRCSHVTLAPEQADKLGSFGDILLAVLREISAGIEQLAGGEAWAGIEDAIRANRQYG